MKVSTTAATRKFVVGSSVAAFALATGALIMIPAALRGVLSSSFLPQAYCYLYDKKLIALHVGSDAVIWLSYVPISCTLVYLVRRTRREIPFSWMFLAFGLFIVACGFTHFMEIVVLWKPLYWLAGDIKLITALASVVTAITLPVLTPQIHSTVKSARLSEDRRQQIERTNAELQRLSTRVMTVQDEERRKIARELHDGIGQYLAAIKMSCETAVQGKERGDGAGALRDSLSLIDRCTAEVRTLSHLLHPPLLEEMGLASAIPWYLEGFTQRSGIEVELDMLPQVNRFPRPLEMTLFRVLQESLTNIHRHSGSKLAKIRLRVENGHAILAIEDRGRGFSVDSVAVKVGVGISSMRERVRELGGELHLTSSTFGTIVEAVLPLQQEATCQSVSLS
ncbi:MAG: sensor histidine kinase [Terriglobales bacterium]